MIVKWGFLHGSHDLVCQTAKRSFTSFHSAISHPRSRWFNYRRVNSLAMIGWFGLGRGWARLMLASIIHHSTSGVSLTPVV